MNYYTENKIKTFRKSNYNKKTYENNICFLIYRRKKIQIKLKT